MIDELTRGQVVALFTGIDRTTGESVDGWWETSKGAAFGAEKLAAILAHDAALRASREVERERAEAAKRRLQDITDELTAAEMRSVAHLKMATETGKQVADLTAKLETMTLERNILYDTAVEDGLSAGTPTIDQAQELARMQSALAASEQRVKELEDLQAAQEMRYNRAEYQRVTLLQMHHSMDAVIQMQKREIERMRGGSEPS